jgi:hypothetical protein
MEDIERMAIHAPIEHSIQVLVGDSTASHFDLVDSEALVDFPKPEARGSWERNDSWFVDSEERKMQQIAGRICC